MSQYMQNNGTLPAQYAPSSMYEGFDNSSQLSYPSSTMPVNYPNSTLPVRAPYPIPATHITLNPYSTQLVDNINRMMNGSQDGTINHIYQVAMSPQLTHLTNTLKKKKCLGGHPGPCHHRNQGTATTDSSVRSDSVMTQEQETDTEMIPSSAEVVFRAVSPHGHVYWEIDPKRPGRILEQSDSDTNNDIHNMSDFSEEDGKIISDRSRQSSSRFSDNRPLISTLNPGQISLQVSSLTPLPENHPSLIQFSPLRFNSLHRPQQQVQQDPSGFSTRTRLGRHPRLRGSMEAIQDEEHCIPEQVQQQVQIPDLRRIPVSVKSSEYIMAKIQTHIDHQRKQGSPAHGTRERKV